MGNYDKKAQGEVLEIIRQMPGINTRDIHALMSHKSAGAIASLLSNMKQRGIIKVVGTDPIKRANNSSGTISKFEVSDNPQPLVRKTRLKKPTEAALNYRFNELLDKIAELEAWKAEAIRRFPDLAVKPVVIRARDLVAAEVEAGGDRTLAQQIRLGQKDCTLMVRVAIKALEEVSE